jgi:hypothetical protein
MKRREFVSLIGGATAWPIAARAQRSGAVRRIAVVGALAADDVETVKRSTVFGRHSLQQAGPKMGPLRSTITGSATIPRSRKKWRSSWWRTRPTSFSGPATS